MPKKFPTFQISVRLKKERLFVDYQGKGKRKFLSLLQRYQKGEEVDFSSLSLGFSLLEGLSLFSRKVLEKVREIPYGKVVSYGEIAEWIGDRRKARAVGNALSKNPLPILIPCHRVIRGDGRLGGFTAGWKVKKWLLEKEGIEIKGKRVVQWKK